MLAEQARWPLLAEPTSGSRTGEAAIRTYRLLLGGPLADEVERVVVFGHPTLSRPVMRLMQRDDVEVLSVPTPGAWSERPFAVDRHLDGRATVEGGRRERLVRALEGRGRGEWAPRLDAAARATRPS